MKVIFIANYFPSASGGVFRIHDLALSLKRLGHDVLILSYMDLHGLLRNIKGAETKGKLKVFRAITLDEKFIHLGLDVIQIISTFIFMSLLLLIEKPCFAIISVPPGIPGIGAFFACKILRRDVAFDVRDEWEDGVIHTSKYSLARYTHVVLKKLFNILYRKANLVITVTPSLVRHLEKRGASNVALIPNGADVNVFYPRKHRERLDIRSELGLDREDMVLVYIGGIAGIEAYYRPDVVIRALHNLTENYDISKVKFMMIGRGEPPKIEEMLKLIRNLGLQDKVIFLGEQKRKNVARILSCCDAGIVPYDDNPLWVYAQPTKFFEYCASGLPVIATVMEGSELASLVRKYKVGYIIEPLNIIEIASAVGRFYNLSEKERNDMSERARSLVINSFDRLIIARKLVETLEGV